MEDAVSFAISVPVMDKGYEEFSKHVGVSSWEILIKRGPIINRHGYYLMVHHETRH